MENRSRGTSPNCLLLAGAALCAAQASAAGKASITVGAIVLPASQCRADPMAAIRCTGPVPPPAVSSSAAPPAVRARHGGEVVLKMTPVAAALDSREVLAPSEKRIVLTIAP